MMAGVLVSDTSGAVDWGTYNFGNAIGSSVTMAGAPRGAVTFTAASLT